MSKARLALTVDAEVHGALKIESAATHRGMTEIIEELVRTHCADSIRQYQERQQADAAHGGRKHTKRAS